MATTVEATFRDRYGLHPRAAMQIQRAAARFRATATLQNAAGSGRPVDTRSVMALVAAGVRTGDRVRVTAAGDDEIEAADAIAALMERGVCHP